MPTCSHPRVRITQPPLTTRFSLVRMARWFARHAFNASMFRMITRMQAQVQLNNPTGKFCRDGDHERAPPRTLKVGALRNGTIPGPVPNRPNRSGTATLPNGKLRLCGSHASCSLGFIYEVNVRCHGTPPYGGIPCAPRARPRVSEA